MTFDKYTGILICVGICILIIITWIVLTYVMPKKTHTTVDYAMDNNTYYNTNDNNNIYNLNNVNDSYQEYDNPDVRVIDSIEGMSYNGKDSIRYKYFDRNNKVICDHKGDAVFQMVVPWQIHITHIASLSKETKEDIVMRMQEYFNHELGKKHLVFPVKLSPYKPNEKVLYNIDNYKHYWHLGPIHNMKELIRLIIVLKHNVDTHSFVDSRKIWEGGILITSVNA